jgi:hypothetical protein
MKRGNLKEAVNEAIVLWLEVGKKLNVADT